MPMYLNVNGITGDSTATGFTGWFTVMSANWSVTNSPSGVIRAGQNVPTALTVTMAMTIGSPLLFTACVSHQTIKSVELDITNANNNSVAQKIILTPAMITDYQIDADSGSPTILTLSFAMESIEIYQAPNQRAQWNFKLSG